MGWDNKDDVRENEEERKIDILAKVLEKNIKDKEEELEEEKEELEEEDKESRENEEESMIYVEKIRVPATIAGFIVLGTGIAVLLKAIWTTSLLGETTWYVLLFVGILLIIIGIVAVSRSTISS